MSRESKEILQSLNDSLQKVLEYQYASVDSLTDKAANFLSFSMIINSLLAGYAGTIFLLVELGFITVNWGLTLVLHIAVFSLVAAIVCLLIVSILATQSLGPKIIAMPVARNLDEIPVLHRTFEGIAEWYLERQKNIIDAIKENECLCEKLARNLKKMSIVTIVAAIFLIAFIVLTLFFALGNIISTPSDDAIRNGALFMCLLFESSRPA